MQDSHNDILYLNKEEVRRLCEDIDSVAIIREVFSLHGSQDAIVPDEAYLAWTNAQRESARSLNMPGYLGGSFQIAGTKIINSNIHNPIRGLPRADGLTLLYDSTNTRITCIMDAAYISSLRTASVSALAIDVCMQQDMQCLAIIGAGALARAHIELLARRLTELREIRLFDQVEARAVALQQDVSALLDEYGIAWHTAATAREAIREAQVIIPATTTTEGYIPFAWLQPGTLLVNISLDDPLPEIVLKADTVIVDDWHLVKNDTRRLLGRMYRAGQLLGPDDALAETPQGARRVDAQLGDVVTGKKVGRRRPEDIVLVNPFGLSIEDIAVASCVYQAARAHSIGTPLQR